MARNSWNILRRSMKFIFASLPKYIVIFSIWYVLKITHASPWKVFCPGRFGEKVK